MKHLQLSLEDVRNFISTSFAAGVAYHERLQRPSRDKLTQREAFRKFGRTSVERWLRLGLISRSEGTTAKASSPRYYSLAEIVKAQAVEQMQFTLSTTEIKDT